MSQSGSEFDPKKAESFAARLMNALNDGALCLMTSIGHRTGLFDAMRDQPPRSFSEIAAQTGLNERYVREWLGAVTTGVVEYDQATETFFTPPKPAVHRG